MDHRRATEHLGAAVTSYAGLITGADLTTPVPTCPGWDLRKVTKHVGTVHRWSAEMVRTRATGRVDTRTLDLGLPAADDELPAWIEAGGHALVATLDAADGDDPMWAWGVDQHVRFWSRRMLHETIAHRNDAELALGRWPEVDAALAVDGIDELLENLPAAASFSPEIAELRGDGESIHLHATDVEGEWMIDLHTDGFTVGHGHGKGTVAVRATASDLLLLLYRRADAADERFTRFGDAAVLDRWIAHSALG